MTTGDIDDALGSEEELASLLRSNRPLAEYLQRAPDLPISRAYDVPFGFGISFDGQRRYGDRHLHTRFRGIEISSAPATHESTEWGLREYAQIGVNYEKDSRGHRLANRAELTALCRLFPNVPPEELWRDYSNFLDPQIKRDERENIESPPPDLALYPYRGLMLEHLKSKGVKNEESSRVGLGVGGADSQELKTRRGNETPPQRNDRRRNVPSSRRRETERKR